jgi:hypothetical protein
MKKSLLKIKVYVWIFQLVQIVGTFLENKGSTWIEFIVRSYYLVAILSLA